MLMNKRILWLSLSLAAMFIMLAALPGSSQKVQSTNDSALVQLQERLCALEARAQQAATTLSNREELLARLQDVQKLQIPDDGENRDVEVFVGNGGSWLGIETREVSSENVKDLKLPAERGALVGKIIPDSPAAKAGLKENDVIAEVNGQRIEGTAQFRRMIREIPAGRTAQLTVLRDGHSQNVSVTLGKMQSSRIPGPMVRGSSPGSFVFQVPEISDIENLEELNVFGNYAGARPRLGIDAEDLRGALGTYLGAPDGEGVLVRNVFSGTPAEKAGLKAGDVITSVDGQRVRSVSDLREQLKAGKAEGKSCKVGLLRNKAELSLTVEFPARPKREVHQSSERTNL
jgi:C-terminal processing protease CtpA/Prc